MKNKKDFLIHFVGIKGVGMTALALLVKGAGFSVSGSDQPGTFITSVPLKKAAVTIYDSFSEEHVKKASLVITTGAHGGFGNTEVVTARANGITVWTFGEALGKFMDGTLISSEPYKGISITGTHGKTTTSAMIATLFCELKLDPCYIIGTSLIPSLPLGAPGHFGKGEYFVAEADEYVAEPLSDKTPKMLYQHPKIAVLTSVELDHPDVYDGIDDVIENFVKFVEALPPDGVLVACGDSEDVRRVVNRATCNVRTYGFSPQNDFVITRVFISGDQTFFWVKGAGTDLGEFRIHVSGEHNALNALAAVIVGLEVGQDVSRIKKAMQKFTGSKRRMEFIGKMKSGALLYDDYAHHPEWPNRINKFTTI
jgi:UDP-N-acetylmuramate--alanine ligase